MIKKHKSKLCLFSFFFFLICLFLSCTNILDKEPPDYTEHEKSLTTISDARSALHGCYSGLQEVGYYGRNFIVLADLLADNTKLSPNNSDKFISMYNHSYTSTDPEIKSLWLSCYKVISRANNIIKAIDNIGNDTKSEKDQIFAEALSLRALAMFDLIRIFALPYSISSFADSADGMGSHLGIPIIIETFSNDSLPFPPRSSVKKCYNQIINDLNKADSLFSIKFSSPYYFSKMSAKSLLSRVYLYKHDYINAFNSAVDVLSSNYFNLIPHDEYFDSWHEVFTTESILSIAMSNNDYKGTEGLGYIFLRKGYNDIIPTQDIISIFETNDIRALLIDRGTEIRKYPGRNETPGLDNVPLIRYSELFLILAEAATQYDIIHTSDYYYGIAITALDSLRKRAIPNAAPTNIRGEKLLELIQEERRRELAFEGHRLFDLARTSNDIIRIDCNSDKCQIPFPSKHFILPIPQQEINANGNIIQNPGY